MTTTTNTKMAVGHSAWKCPRCGRWTRDEMARTCAACKAAAKAATATAAEPEPAAA